MKKNTYIHYHQNTICQNPFENCSHNIFLRQKNPDEENEDLPCLRFLGVELGILHHLLRVKEHHGWFLGAELEILCNIVFVIQHQLGSGSVDFGQFIADILQ